MKNLHAQNDETKGDIEFLKQQSVVAVDTLPVVGTVVI
jgi:hypothetical protein